MAESTHTSVPELHIKQHSAQAKEEAMHSGIHAIIAIGNFWGYSYCPQEPGAQFSCTKAFLHQSSARARVLYFITNLVYFLSPQNPHTPPPPLASNLTGSDVI